MTTRSFKLNADALLKTAGGLLLTLCTAVSTWVVGEIRSIELEAVTMRERVRALEVRGDGIGSTLQDIKTQIREIGGLISEQRREISSESKELRKLIQEATHK